MTRMIMMMMQDKMMLLRMNGLEVRVRGQGWRSGLKEKLGLEVRVTG